MSTTKAGGFLGSYRYMLTPRSALELNYWFAQYSLKYHSAGVFGGRGCMQAAGDHRRLCVLAHLQELQSVLEAGVGGMIFTPILDAGTHELSLKQNTNLGALFGGGVAYEINPSFDIRIGYRGFLLKAPDFGSSDLKTNRYYVLMTPQLGIAYHF